MGSTDEEILKIEEKAKESKEDDEEVWKENNKDSKGESSDNEEESSDNSSGENTTDNRSKNSNVLILDETEGNGGKVEEGEWKKIGIKGSQRIRVRTKTTRTKITARM